MPRFLLLLVLLLTLVAGCRGGVSRSPATLMPRAYPVPDVTRPPAIRLPYPFPGPFEGIAPASPEPQRRASYPLPPTQPPGGVTNPTPLLEPTPFPTLAPDRLRPTLLNALQVTRAAPGAYQIGDWPGGWRSAGYCRTGPLAWLDENHLLLFPLTGLDMSGAIAEHSSPVVVDLARETIWLPYPTGESVTAFYDCRDQPVWSVPAGILAALQPERIYLYGFNGVLREELSRPAHSSPGVSPSGRWLFTGQEFFDLGAEAPPGPLPPFGTHYAWDAAEQRVFACCNLFAERDSAPESWEPEDIQLNGGGFWPGSFWTPDGRYAYNFVDYTRASDGKVIFPLFDPQTQTYVDLLELAGLPNRTMSSIRCHPVAVSPDGRWLMIACDAAEKYLVDLLTYNARPLGGFANNSPLFSANGEFLVSHESFSSAETASSPVQFWRTEDGTTFFFELPHGEVFWHPTRPWLALTHSGEGGVTLFDARQRKVLAEIEAAAPVRQALWAPQGDGLLLAREDGRLAWLADPLFSQDPVILNEIPHAELSGLQISPDGRRVALVDGGTVYVYPLP